MSPEDIRREMRQKRNLKLEDRNNSEEKIPFGIWMMIKFLVTVLLTLTILIGIKKSDTFKALFYKEVYETNFSFAYVNNIYQKVFGSPIPFSEYIKEPVKATFKETLTFTNKEKYNDGVKLTVEENYLVPIKNSGLVVFIGEKEGYGNTVIIQQMDGIDLWYGNLKDVNVKLYDYVEEGNLLGEVEKDTLYLVFKKEGNNLNYEEYLS